MSDINAINVRAGNLLREVQAERNPFSRYNKLKAEWSNSTVQDVFKTLPMAENTFSTTLTTQFLVDGAVTKLQNLLSPLLAVSRDFSVDRYKPLATGQLKFVTGGSNTLTVSDGGSFEQGDSAVGPVTVTVNHYSQPFHVTSTQLNSGLRLDDLVTINAKKFGNKVLETLFTPLTKSAYGDPSAITAAASAFAWSTMSTAWGKIKKSPIKNAVLDGEYLANLINQPSFYQRTGAEGGNIGWKTFGWDGVYECTDWTGTPSGDFTRGVFCGPQALGALSGLPLLPAMAGQTLATTEMEIPDVGMTIANNIWFALATRTLWSSYDVMFGAAALDTTAACLLTSQ